MQSSIHGGGSAFDGFCFGFFLFSDFLCIWNTNFQTLQAGKEMAGKIYGQVGTVLKRLNPTAVFLLMTAMVSHLSDEWMTASGL